MSECLNDREARMLLATISEPGDAETYALIARHGAEDAFGRVRAGEVSDRLRHRTAPALAAIPEPKAHARALRASTDACGARLIIPGDPEWPRQLESVRGVGTALEPRRRAPWCLWVRGNSDLNCLARRSVTITGSRAATEYGTHVADELAAAGWTIAAGGAVGIDATAHRSALAHNGSTIAVLPCGLATPYYPRSNQPLLEAITERSLLVSEHPPGTPVARYRFLSRAWALAALTAGTVIVEASDRSTAPVLARYTAEFGRALMLVPGPVTSLQSAGVHRIARTVPQARFVTSADDIIADLTGPIQPAPPTRSVRPAFDELNEPQQWLVEALPRGYVVETDRLAAAAGIPAAVALEALQALQADAWAEQIDGRWRLASGPW